MFTERLIELAHTKASCTIFTVFGHAEGGVQVCDGEIFTFATKTGKILRLYCEDVLGLAE